MKTDLKLTNFQKDLLKTLEKSEKTGKKIILRSPRRAWRTYLGIIIAYVKIVRFILQYYLLKAILNGRNN